ncbi:MAG: VWA domain-containing protein [Neomegalonema sp.]|nr:VWA domain-containing protein [Neomegalonema sp.]
MFGKICALLARFWRDPCGATGVMAAGAIPVLTIMVGAGVDYARVEDARSRLQHAADSAALAVAQAQVLELDKTKSRGDAMIDANFTVPERVKITGREIIEKGAGYAKVKLTAEVDMFFLELVGFKVLEVEVVSEAQYKLAPDLDITVLLDTSGSMLIGASKTDIAGFEDLFGCAFACHLTQGGHKVTYEKALTSGFKTRLDVARDAILRSFKIASESAYADKASTYFDVKTFAYELEDVVTGEAKDLVGAAGDPVRKIQPAPWTGKGSIYAATDFIKAFATSKTVLAKKTANPDRQYFVLLVTDGVADFMNPGRKIEPIDPALCKELKENGVRIGVIYTTYFDIPSNGFWRSRVKPFSSQIGPKLAECATPGWFFEAEYADDIDAAFVELMKLVLPRPQLTK